MISDTYICKTHVFKVVLSLVLLNSLGLLKSRKKNVKLIYFPISPKKYFNYCPKIWGLSLVEGPRRWLKWPRP